MASNHPLARPLQICGALLFVLTILLAMVLVLYHGQWPDFTTKWLPAIYCVLGGLAGSAIIIGLASALESRDTSDPAVRRLLGEIRDQLSQLPASLAQQPAAADQDNSAPQVAPTDMAQVVQLLDEIRDVTLMNPIQRQQRLDVIMTMRRQSATTVIDELIRQTKWAEARATLQQALVMYGPGPELDAIGTMLASVAGEAEQKALADLRLKTRDLIATDNWEQALAESQAVRTRFPESPAITQFDQKLQADRTNYIETTANGLYEEIKLDIEQRSWRRALGAAQRLLAKCPGHPRAKTIESQIPIIRENADTEQRNAMEIRIHEFVKSNRIRDAITLAEDLVKGYPQSPQAQVASQLIIKLRERLEHPKEPTPPQKVK